MLYFDCDYMEGAHPAILKRLTETNFDQTIGYGRDPYCEAARAKIRAACRLPDTADVHFLVGGTQANKIVISTTLRPCEGVLAAATGHIAVHEAGAIENAGHKVIPLPAHEGKIDPADVRSYMTAFRADESFDHMVMPRMVYLSHPSEYGTLYTRAELEELRRVCDAFGLILYLDGARLGYGLVADGTDLTLPDIAALTDLFYIGGTKVGALFGEALVVRSTELTPYLFTTVKQGGGLLAKGRLLGIQFDTLFTDGLYESISRHAVELAMKLKKGLTEKGYSFFLDSVTNQQFPILENDQIRALRQHVSFGCWDPVDEHHTTVRFATSWATDPAAVDALLALL